MLTFTLEITHVDGTIERAVGNRRWIEPGGILRLVYEQVGPNCISTEVRGAWDLRNLRTWQVLGH